MYLLLHCKHQATLCTLEQSLFPGIRTNSTFLEIVLKRVFLSERWSSYQSLPFLQLSKEECFRHPVVLHSCKVTSPAELHLDNMALNAGDVGYPALPLETAYGTQVTLLELFEEFYMSTI